MLKWFWFILLWGESSSFIILSDFSAFDKLFLQYFLNNIRPKYSHPTFFNANVSSAINRSVVNSMKLLSAARYSDTFKDQIEIEIQKQKQISVKFIAQMQPKEPSNVKHKFVVIFLFFANSQQPSLKLTTHACEVELTPRLASCAYAYIYIYISPIHSSEICTLKYSVFPSTVVSSFAAHLAPVQPPTINLNFPPATPPGCWLVGDLKWHIKLNMNK